MFLLTDFLNMKLIVVASFAKIFHEIFHNVFAQIFLLLCNISSENAGRYGTGRTCMGKLA